MDAGPGVQPGPVSQPGAAHQAGRGDRAGFTVSQRDAVDRADALRAQRAREAQPYAGPVVVAPTEGQRPGYGLPGVLRTRRLRAKGAAGTGDSMQFLRDREHAKLVKRAQEVRQSAAEGGRAASTDG